MTGGLRRLPEAAPKIRNLTAEEGRKVQVPLTDATLVITSDMVLQARKYVQSGALKGTIVEWRDGKQVELVLRLGSKTATWHLRRKRKTFRIGSADEISIITARRLANAAKIVDDFGSDANLYFEEMRNVIRKDGHEAAYYYDQKIWIDDDLRLHGLDVPMPATVWTWSYLPAAPLAPPAELAGWSQMAPVSAGPDAEAAIALPVGLGAVANLLPTPVIHYALRPETAPYLHDGRAATLAEAIAAHGYVYEAAQSEALLTYLHDLTDLGFLSRSELSYPDRPCAILDGDGDDR
ncbi:MAG: hypothetical protein PGN25_14050 [Methylorubrum populi]